MWKKQQHITSKTTKLLEKVVMRYSLAVTFHVFPVTIKERKHGSHWQESPKVYTTLGHVERSGTHMHVCILCNCIYNITTSMFCSEEKYVSTTCLSSNTIHHIRKDTMYSSPHLLHYCIHVTLSVCSPTVSTYMIYVETQRLTSII